MEWTAKPRSIRSRPPDRAAPRWRCRSRRRAEVACSQAASRPCGQPFAAVGESPLSSHLAAPIHQAHLVGLRPPVHARVPRRCHRILLCLRYARPVGMSRCLPVPVLVLDGTDSPLGVQRGEAARALPSQALEAPCAVGCSWLLADFTRAPAHDNGRRRRGAGCGSCRSRGKRQAAYRRTLENRRTGFPQLPQLRRLRRPVPHRDQNPSPQRYRCAGLPTRCRRRRPGTRRAKPDLPRCAGLPTRCRRRRPATCRAKPDPPRCAGLLTRCRRRRPVTRRAKPDLSPSGRVPRNRRRP